MRGRGVVTLLLASQNNGSLFQEFVTGRGQGYPILDRRVNLSGKRKHQNVVPSRLPGR